MSDWERFHSVVLQTHRAALYSVEFECSLVKFQFSSLQIVLMSKRAIPNPFDECQHGGYFGLFCLFLVSWGA